MNSEADNVIDNDYYNDGNGGRNDTYDRDDESGDRLYSQAQSTNNDTIYPIDTCSEVQFAINEVNSGTL